jgi:hypothetical protein
MDDLLPSRPAPATGVEGYTPEEKKSSEKRREKQVEKRKPNAVTPPNPPSVDETDGEEDHKLDERA